MRHNGRTPIKASSMRPENLNLREGEIRSVVCPDCNTWHRLTRSMIHPHRDGVEQPKAKGRHYFDEAKQAKPSNGRRCPGSAQRIEIDLTLEEWGQALLAADGTAIGRRSARQHYKPLPAPAKPVTRMSPVPVSAVDALTAYREHLKKCRASTTAGRCGGTHRCADGARLAALYAQLQRTQPRRDREARVDALLARYRSTRGWAKHSEATTNAKKTTAKRSGTTVEEANNACRNRQAGTVSDYRGPHVPLAPLRISA